MIGLFKIPLISKLLLLIKNFKTRVLADGGAFEAEACLKTSLPTLIQNGPSLVITPNAVKTGKLYSIVPTDGTGDSIVTRATTATRVNSSGLIENVGAKTGTSNWSSTAKNGMAGKSRDLWMSAYTSDYICSVWMGFGKEGIDKGKTTSQYKAYPGKVVQTLLNHLQSKGSQKSYPDQPDDVEQAAMVKGIYPYVSPSEGMSEDMIIQAWFKKGTAPAQSVDSDVFNLAGLSSFDVSLSGQSITFNFAPYNPENAVTDENANDATKTFGKVVYTVVVQDQNGQELHR